MPFGQTYNATDDLSELKQMLSSFENYLKGSNLYGSVGGGFLTGGRNPQLTVGAVLMRLRRLHVLADDLNEKQRNELANLSAQHDEIRNDNVTRYDAKIDREANSRIDAMQRFFEECRDDPKNCGSIYGPEVLRRTITQELLNVMGDDIIGTELEAKVKKTDRMLRSYVQESEFLWADELEPAYPRNVYWWMYVAPQKR
jgi:hypothetical protein